MNQDLLKKNFEKHGFTTAFFPTSAEAVAYLTGQIQGRTIGFGGSITVREMGLFDALAQNNVCVWHHRVAGEETRKLASFTRIYISSANAVSETGEIVNIDGTGNRLAMSLYGPEKVYFVVGRNKVTPDLDTALYRARNVASPKNAQRFHLSTPCAIKGDRCYDCDSPERICRATLILDRAPNRTPSEIIFIDEDLGY